MSEEWIMRVIYNKFPSGDKQGHMIHTAKGVLIFKDPVESEYWAAQYHEKNGSSGPIPEKTLDAMLKIKFEGHMAHIELPGHEDVYVIRDIRLSEEAQRGLEKVMAYQRKDSTPVPLRQEDHAWVRDIASQFGEYRGSVAREDFAH